MLLNGRGVWIISCLIALSTVASVGLFFYHKTDHIPAFIQKGSSKIPFFNTDKWSFEADLSGYSMPSFDRKRLKNYSPHNYKGPGNRVFGLFYTSRDATNRNPYFVAVNQIIYRLLWDPARKSSFPVVVFVTEVVSEEQREYFAAAGAMVREVKLNGFQPVNDGVPARLLDMFSKLQMWRQTDFSRIAYFDGDAFPEQNIDAIFDLVPEQRCIKDRLSVEDQHDVAGLCDYAFGGYEEIGDNINAGVMVIKPSEAMHERLLRQSLNKTGWDTGMMEQGLLNHAYGPDTAFPHSTLSHEWNSGKDQQGLLDIKILHHKSWGDYWEPGSWAMAEFKQVWADMLAFYNSPAFEDAREEDLQKSSAALDNVKPGA